MEFSWTIFLAVVVANLGCVAFMFFVQEAFDRRAFLPARHSLIPDTGQRFLYFQDFHTMTWGDMFGIPLIINAFVHLMVSGHITKWQWALFAIVAVVDAIGFRKMCHSKTHKPDMGFPDIGKTSCLGLTHLPYHGIGVACALFAIGHAIIGNVRGPVLYVALAGGVIYIASFIADIRSGNFDPLKRI